MLPPTEVETDRLCINCANARNQYGDAYTQPTDEVLCIAVANLVTGTHARCEEFRKPGVQMSRCGEGGVLWLAMTV